MGLLNKFEAEDNAATATATKPAADTAAAPAPAAAAPAEAQTASTALASKPANTAVVVAKKIDLSVMDSYKDAMRVEYNTLNQITAQQGVFLDRETKTNLGDTIVFTLLSYQDSYVVSPEDDNAPDDMVRYSDDGITCSDGTPVAEHIEVLKTAGFKDARVKERNIVVAAVESAAKSDAFNGNLVQFDLSPASRVQWKRYMANAAYAVATGRAAGDSVTRIKATTSLAQGGGNNAFTLVKFEIAK